MSDDKRASVRHLLRVVLFCLALIAALPAGSMSLVHNAFVVTGADFVRVDPAQQRLGKLLFFDKVISGNRNISCATCHNPLAATGDGLSLSMGEGARGLGVARDAGAGPDAVPERVPRNAPALFNLGAREFHIMFHDGRVMVDAQHPAGFRTPAGDDLPAGLSGALAAQAMFPVTSGTEMAGQAGENPVADAAAAGRLAGPGGVWDRLAERLRAIPAYVALFADAFPDVEEAADITFVHAANAIAAFEAGAWQCTGSAFDRYNAHDFQAISPKALLGMQLFYGRAGCASCHAGPFQTDHDFHAIGVPQIGPGKGDSLPGFADGRDDFGRERVTGDEADRFKFRTPSLRQVALTGPWGHDGAFNDLEAMVRHHLDPRASLASYDPSQAVLPYARELEASDFLAHNTPERRAAIAERIELDPVRLSDDEVELLLAFLHALTDFSCVDLRRDVPAGVPSGLPVFD